MMRGSIEVSSAEGTGTVFWYTALLQKRIEDARVVPRALLQVVRVLTVDDHATNLVILLQQTTGWGMQRDTACNGSFALALLRMIWPYWT